MPEDKRRAGRRKSWVKRRALGAHMICHSLRGRQEAAADARERVGHAAWGTRRGARSVNRARAGGGAGAGQISAQPAPVGWYCSVRAAARPAPRPRLRPLSPRPPRHRRRRPCYPRAEPSRPSWRCAELQHLCQQYAGSGFGGLERWGGAVDVCPRGAAARPAHAPGSLGSHPTGQQVQHCPRPRHTVTGCNAAVQVVVMQHLSPTWRRARIGERHSETFSPRTSTPPSITCLLCPWLGSHPKLKLCGQVGGPAYIVAEHWPQAHTARPARV